MTARAASPWWRALFGGGEASDDDAGPIVVDPTSQLLRTVSHVESRMPWGLVGVLIAVALWLPTVGLLPGPWDGDPGPETGWIGVPPGPEQTWVRHVLDDAAPGRGESVAAWRAARVTWQALGVPRDPRAAGPADRRLLRLPSSFAALLGLIVLFALGRQIAGNAPAVLAVSLAGISAPWTRAATSALPLAPGEVLTLAGVAWALAVQARHREVGVAAVSARRIGGSGVLIGIGLLFAPAHFATLLAVVLVWLFLALRRASSRQTTLPVASPAASAFFAVAGTVILVVCAAAVGWGAELLAGGRGFPYLAGFGVHLEAGRAIWVALWRGFLSPSVATDRILLAALPVIVVVRFAEWFAGKPWRASGLLPWAFLALYFLAFVRGQADVADLVVPLVVPPLFVLGLGWLVLRGLYPGRARRQEYTFLLVWLGVGLATVPFVPSASAQDPRLAVCLALLPPIVLMAGRAGRALWEVDDHPLARIAVFVLVYLPVLAWAGRGAVDALGLADHGLVAALTGRLPLVALGTVVLGAGSELFRVSADRRPRRSVWAGGSPWRSDRTRSERIERSRRSGRERSGDASSGDAPGGRERAGGGRAGGGRRGRGRAGGDDRARGGRAPAEGQGEGSGGRRGGSRGGSSSGGGSRGGSSRGGGSRGTGKRRRRGGRRDGGSR